MGNNLSFGLGNLGWVYWVGKWAAAMATLKIHPGWIGEPKIIKFLGWMPRDVPPN